MPQQKQLNHAGWCVCMYVLLSNNTYNIHIILRDWVVFCCCGIVIFLLLSLLLNYGLYGLWYPIPHTPIPQKTDNHTPATSGNCKTKTLALQKLLQIIMFLCLQCVFTSIKAITKKLFYSFHLFQTQKYDCKKLLLFFTKY